MISPLKAFVLAVAIGAAIPLGFAAKDRLDTARAERAAKADEPSFTKLTPRIYVAAQINPDDLARYRRHTDIRAVIDLRPDGEVAGQPSSAQMAAEAGKLSLDFAYVPTPHGPIPDGVVAQFNEAMSKGGQPVLLYCRSGSRAARVWALSEASRPDGLDAAAILAAVRAAGLSADAEKSEIEQRIAARKTN